MFQALALSSFIVSLVYALFVVYLLMGLLKKKPPVPDFEPVKVSVVIAARNEAENLPLLLDDLMQQDYPRELLEVYVANDRSEDETAAILERYAARYPQLHPIHIRSLDKRISPKKNAITACIQQASTEIILSTDADCRVGPGWVRSAVAHMKRESGILCGFSAVMGQSLMERYQNLDFLALMSANAGFIAQGLAWSGSGQNLVFRRSAFAALGGFGPVGGRLSGDDIYLVQNIPRVSGLKAGFIQDPAHHVRTLPVAGTRNFLRQRMRWASDANATYLRQPLLFLFLLSAFLTNLLLLLNLLVLSLGTYFLLAVIIKFVLEGLVILLGARRFDQRRVLPLFPLWFILQPLYLPVATLGGMLIKHRWKQ